MLGSDSTTLADSLARSAMGSTSTHSAPDFVDRIGMMFQAWNFPGLDSLANWLEILGFCMAVFSLVFTLLIKAEVSSLRTSFLLDKRLPRHIKELEARASELNRLIPELVANRQVIVIELNRLQSELLDLAQKVGWWQRSRLFFLARSAQKRCALPFKQPKKETPAVVLFFTRHVRRVFVTTPGDLWQIHGRLHRVINDMEALKLNRAKALRS